MGRRRRETGTGAAGGGAGAWSLEPWNRRRLGDGQWHLAGEAMVGSIVSTSDNKRAGDREAQSRGREGGGVSLPSKANVLA